MHHWFLPGRVCSQWHQYCLPVPLSSSTSSVLILSSSSFSCCHHHHHDFFTLIGWILNGLSMTYEKYSTSKVHCIGFLVNLVFWSSGTLWKNLMVEQIETVLIQGRAFWQGRFVVFWLAQRFCCSVFLLKSASPLC